MHIVIQREHGIGMKRVVAEQIAIVIQELWMKVVLVKIARVHIDTIITIQVPVLALPAPQVPATLSPLHMQLLKYFLPYL